MSLNQEFLDGMGKASRALWGGAGSSSLQIMSDAMGAFSRQAGAGSDKSIFADKNRDEGMLSRKISCAQGELSYRISAGVAARGGGRPMIVMLHGCKQNPEDFARGTMMNQIAEREGFIVLYPEQSSSSNASACWNWFSPSSQECDKGEPALIAAATREAIREFGVDAGRVYVAGLSAGGAMALIMARAYPDIYSAAGCHSGLPYKSASDLPSALGAMRSGAQGERREGFKGLPLIIFHGDADTTVSQRNARWIMEQNAPAGEIKTREDERGGRRCQTEIIEGPNGASLAESWRVSGAGHAWFGGDSSGSYADASGPNASEEMARFFLSQAPKRSQ